MSAIHNPTRTVSVTGTGKYLPPRVLTNRDLEKIVDTSDEWIYARTGMKERHIAADDQATSDLAAEAAQVALRDAEVDPRQVDMIIVATLSPDRLFPSTACYVQSKIGAVNAFAFDQGAACSGFIFAMETARTYIASGAIETALIIGAEKMSAFLNWKDRSTCILFGDGAGAAVLQARDAKRGIEPAILRSDGTLADLLSIPAGGSRIPPTERSLADELHYLQMDGREVYKYAVNRMTQSVRDILQQSEIDSADIKQFIAHQANARIIKAVGKRLKVMPRMFFNVEKYANTSAAALAIALDEVYRDDSTRHGDLLLLVAFGGGFTWGANIVECYKS